MEYENCSKNFFSFLKCFTVSAEIGLVRSAASAEKRPYGNKVFAVDDICGSIPTVIVGLGGFMHWLLWTSAKVGLREGSASFLLVKSKSLLEKAPQCATPSVWAPDKATRSQTLRPFLEKISCNVEKFAEGEGRLPLTSEERVTVPPLRPIGTSHIYVWNFKNVNARSWISGYKMY